MRESVQPMINQGQIASATTVTAATQAAENNNKKLSAEKQTQYNEYCRLLLANQILTNQMKELVYEKNELSAKLIAAEAKKKRELTGQVDPQFFEEDAAKKKASNHKSATGVNGQQQQTDRPFICPYEACKKTFGHEVYLSQHIRLKHPKIN